MLMGWSKGWPKPKFNWVKRRTRVQTIWVRHTQIHHSIGSHPWPSPIPQSQIQSINPKTYNNRNIKGSIKLNIIKSFQMQVQMHRTIQFRPNTLEIQKNLIVKYNQFRITSFLKQINLIKSPRPNLIYK